MTGMSDCHSIAPTFPSPAGTVAKVTSEKNRVSRGASTIGSEETGVAALPPLATDSWKISVTVASFAASGLKSQMSVWKRPAPWT